MLRVWLSFGWWINWTMLSDFRCWLIYHDVDGRCVKSAVVAGVVGRWFHESNPRSDGELVKWARSVSLGLTRSPVCRSDCHAGHTAFGEICRRADVYVLRLRSNALLLQSPSVWFCQSRRVTDRRTDGRTYCAADADGDGRRRRRGWSRWFADRIRIFLF